MKKKYLFVFIFILILCGTHSFYNWTGIISDQSLKRPIKEEPIIENNSSDYYNKKSEKGLIQSPSTKENPLKAKPYYIDDVLAIPLE